MKQVKIEPSTPTKKESSSSSTKTKAKGFLQKERDLLEYLKDDPSMRQIVLQKILDKKGEFDDDETLSSATSSSPQQQKPGAILVFKTPRTHMNYCQKHGNDKTVGKSIQTNYCSQNSDRTTNNFMI
uniref:Uncharacterized protein n=1 Tax=Opuntia streptacantha TaxID=393608 RepID=A0A7C8Z3P8_OPUST